MGGPVMTSTIISFSIKDLLVFTGREMMMCLSVRLRLVLVDLIHFYRKTAVNL